jgi:predicted DsbA family dithiol-disulfide isomerase
MTAVRSSTKLVVDVVSDVVCPWCYIGKRHLERALDGFEGDFIVRWHPFQLNPDLPSDGIDRKSYLEEKFGGAARAKQIYSRVEEAGRNAGLGLQIERIQRQPNTLAAHALIAYAQSLDAETANRVSERLFQAYFVEGQFIGDIDTLCELAEDCELDATAVREFITDPAQLAQIAARDEEVRRQGVSGVPFFIFNNQRAVSGAQPPEVLKEAIAQSLASG